MTALDKAIEILGSPGQLARAIGVSDSVVSNWRARGSVAAERCIDIEVATGGKVTRYDLRPTIFGSPPANRKEAA